MSSEGPYHLWCVDSPSPFAPMEVLQAFREEVLGMLKQYPDHPQWSDELNGVNEIIQRRLANPLPGDDQ